MPSRPQTRTPLLLTLFGLLSAPLAAEEPPDFSRDVAPLLKKYCVGCHSGDQAEGKLSLESHEAMLRGGSRGAAVLAGRGVDSRLIRLLRGEAKPAMPPDDEPRPSKAEIDLIQRWIDAGAKGPGGKPADAALVTPQIEPRGRVPRRISALAVGPDGSLAALARPGGVELISVLDGRLVRTLSGCAGQVNAVSFSADGKHVVAAGGEPGLFGEATLWTAADGRLVTKLRGHRDSLYAARLAPDGRLLATGGYDQKIVIWDAASGETLRTIAGHNAAVLDLDFSPNGRILASASGDRTVKLWDPATGARLDTLGQPLRDVYAVAFSPDGRALAAGGADRRVRVWSISADGREGSNPLLFTRFGHDGAVLRLAWSRDGATLVSSAENRTIKVWDAVTMTPRQALPEQSDVAAGLALTPDGARLLVGRMDGSFAALPISPPGDSAIRQAESADSSPAQRSSPLAPEPPLEIAETEPNDSPEQAAAATPPAVVNGSLSRPGDVDLVRIRARRGETWILETLAARGGSRADTKLDVLDAAGKPVVRALLQATRDSAVTFRGADSNAVGFRLLHWEEMELNQYLYVGGEVVKLYRFPQGPDSDFLFYDAGGRRRCYFDTSPVAHYLDEPCYIVRPVPPDAQILPTGLPVFPLYFSNDDDSLRRLGSDSRLTFTAPADGEYLVRVTDARGFGGEKYTYRLTIQPPRPDFRPSLAEVNAAVPPGGGRRFMVRLERIDGFEGEVRVEVAGLPPGFAVSGPLFIEAGHDFCRGVLTAAADAPPPTQENAAASVVTCSALIGGRKVTRSAGGFGALTLAPKPKLAVRLELDPAGRPLPPSNAEELTIAPGAMVSAMLRIERAGFEGEVKFDVDNLPHGVIVDDIGLNGILITPGQSSRQIYLSCRPWVTPSLRPFHAVALAEGNPASPPLLLRVARPRP
jgi:WD40 repeat protein